MDKRIHTENFIVFLDVSIGEEKVGRIIIELFNHIAPKTAENFRALCTGEKGTGKNGNQLHLAGSYFHKVIPEFMIQGGDITHFDGTGGESIYGPSFEDENFSLKHKFEGQLSLANTGLPNSNNSQFFITLAPCPHLDGKNVVFGCVRSGLGVAKEVSRVQSENDKPLVKCVINNCGQLVPHDDWGLVEIDGSQDIFPPFPEDWKQSPDQVQQDEMEDVIGLIKASGNEFFKVNHLVDAQRKYKKAIRYINWYNKSSIVNENQKHFKDAYTTVLLNYAAVQLKFKNYKEVVHLCNQVISLEGNNVKALFRRGRAQVAMNNYEAGLEDYNKALRILPHDRHILKERAVARQLILRHVSHEKKVYARMFKT